MKNNQFPPLEPENGLPEVFQDIPERMEPLEDAPVIEELSFDQESEPLSENQIPEEIQEETPDILEIPMTEETVPVEEIPAEIPAEEAFVPEEILPAAQPVEMPQIPAETPEEETIPDLDWLEAESSFIDESVSEPTNPEPVAEELPLEAIVATTAGDYETDGGSSEGPAELATDGNAGTKWHTEWHPEANNSYDELEMLLYYNSDTF